MKVSIEVSEPLYEFMTEDAHKNGFSSFEEYLEEEIVYDFYKVRKNDEGSYYFRNKLQQYFY